MRSPLTGVTPIVEPIPSYFLDCASAFYYCGQNRYFGHGIKVNAHHFNFLPSKWLSTILFTDQLIAVVKIVKIGYTDRHNCICSVKHVKKTKDIVSEDTYAVMSDSIVLEQV